MYVCRLLAIWITRGRFGPPTIFLGSPSHPPDPPYRHISNLYPVPTRPPLLFQAVALREIDPQRAPVG
jgi:hypothetical protein